MNLKENQQKILNVLCCIVIAFLIFILGILTSLLVINQQYNEDLTEFFDLNYHNFIQKEGASNIDFIVRQVENKSSPDEKLNSIADLIVTNFTDLFWAESSENLFVNECPAKVTLNHHYFFNNCNGYGFDRNGAVRIRSGNLTQNPYWIAYYRTGACGELATLFANVSNQSGFVSRVVYSSDPDHAWTEIYINGEWIYFDPDMYHGFHGDPKYEKEWFDNTSSFKEKIGWDFSKISVANSTPDGYEEDRTYSYTRTGTIKLIFLKPIERIVIRQENHDSYTWTIKPSCSSYPCIIESSLGSGKKYVLQTYTLGFFDDIKKFSLKENETKIIGVDVPIRFEKTSYPMLSEINNKAWIP